MNVYMHVHMTDKSIYICMHSYTNLKVYVKKSTEFILFIYEFKYEFKYKYIYLYEFIYEFLFISILI